MVDYEQPDTDSQPDAAADPGNGPRLPGGVTLETAASAVLVVVLVALLWIFFGPRLGSDEVPGLTTATATPASRAPRGEADAATPSSATAEASAQAKASAGAEASADAEALSTAADTAAPADASRGSTPQTPSGIVKGGYVRVGGTGGMDLRYRFGPGTEFLTIRIAEEGEVMKVVGGPEVEEGLTWWRLQDARGNIGWAVEDYVAPVAAPAAWNPPAASPTFESPQEP